MDDIQSSGGGMGAIRQFSERTMLVYTFSQLNDHATLGSVVILRSAGPIRELQHHNPLPSATMRKLVRERHREPGSGGSGATCGPHNIHLDQRRPIVWLDADRELVFSGYNVLMLDDIQASCCEVPVAGLDSIDIDISGEYLVRRALRDSHDMDRKVADSVLQLPSVKSFCI